MKTTITCLKKSYLFLIFIIAISSNINAQEKANNYALFIAIDDYQGAVWQPLKTAVNDANKIKAILESKYDFQTIGTLYNEAATRSGILEMIKTKISQVKETDNLIIYYSGRSVNLADSSYWIPHGVLEEKAEELIAAKALKSLLSKVEAKHLLIFADAHLDENIFKVSDLSFPNDGSEKYYKQVNSLLSRQAITSGSFEPFVNEGDENSTFAKYLHKFLEKNENIFFDGKELFDLIKYPVMANTPNPPNFGYLQNLGHEGGQFIFSKKQLVASKEKEVVKTVGNTPKSTSPIDGNSTTKSIANKVTGEPGKIDTAPMEGVGTVGAAGKTEEKLCDSPVYFEEGEVVRFNQDGGILHAKTSFENIRYEWSYESELLEFTGKDLKVTKPGMYGVTIITADGDCSNSAIAEVEIVMPEIVIDILGGKLVEFVHKGKLSATITGFGGKMIYEWRKGNFSIGNQPDLEVTESDTYTIIVKLPDGRELGRESTQVKVSNRKYIIQVGDDIERVSRKFYGTPNQADLIIAANENLTKGTPLKVGEEISIPYSKTVSIKSITIGTTESFPPFSDKNGFNGGLLTDIVNNIYKEMHQPIEMSFVPNKEIKGVYNGRTELGFPLVKNKTDEMLFLYSDPIYTSLIVLFALKNNTEITDLEDEIFERNAQSVFEKIKIAIPINFINDELIEYAENGKILLKPQLTLEECFIAVSEGKADLVAAPQLAGLVALKNSASIHRMDFKILEESLATSTLHLVVSKEHPDADYLIEDFNTILEMLTVSGRIDQIINQHIDLIQKGKP